MTYYFIANGMIVEGNKVKKRISDTEQITLDIYSDGVCIANIFSPKLKPIHISNIIKAYSVE